MDCELWFDVQGIFLAWGTGHDEFVHDGLAVVGDSEIVTKSRIEAGI